MVQSQQVKKPSVLSFPSCRSWPTGPPRCSSAMYQHSRQPSVYSVASRATSPVTMMGPRSPAAPRRPGASYQPPARAVRSVRCAVNSRPSTVMPAPPLPVEEMNLWLTAAQNFEMNTDFDVGSLLADGRRRPIQEVMDVMKANSGGKGTIQALGDKIVLAKLLENLSIPQMPVLFSTYSQVTEEEVENLVSSWTEEESYDVVIKPTHLSSATGAIFMCKTKWEKESWDAQKLTEHMRTYLQKKASDSESEALKSLVPGFVVQPRYRSAVNFNFPLELRVVTVWGKARVGIWWWGRPAEPKGRRSTWLVRKPRGEFSEEDDWEVIHEHHGGNRGFEVSLQLFREAMPVMCAAAEAIATAVGAPFLRSDFFVGNSKWGVRLNEVAYGSGLDYRRRGVATKQTKGGSWVGGLVDDGPAIAEILQEGFKICQRKPPAHFLRTLGARNAIYEAPASYRKPEKSKPEPHMRIEAVPPEQRLRLLPDDAVNEMVQRYARPSNILAQTGTVSGASCETQPPGLSPVTQGVGTGTKAPFPVAWGYPKVVSPAPGAPGAGANSIRPPALAPYQALPAVPWAVRPLRAKVYPAQALPPSGFAPRPIPALVAV
ncbi:Uncharacterized protein SCF082_LOCUS1390 [Durusdinium trenchii]|uniref:ATP-grasp domain-containing protein n=1 Tax=Durusdinium trenchii TaxID=1381693 RepID=A0ABP0HHW7_9DINO